MQFDSIRQSAEQIKLKESISRRFLIDSKVILTFEDFDLFLPGLIENFQSPTSRLIAASPVISSIPIAADRAEIKLVTAESKQPLAGETESIKSAIKSEHDVIYLANPNRLTGCSHSLKEIKKIAALIKNGLLIIDEYYHDFSDISAISLLETFENVVVVRPFEKWTNPGQLNSGYALFNQGLVNGFSAVSAPNALNRQSAGKCLEIFENERAVRAQVGSIQKRALAVAKELTALGIECRILPTNFVLLHFKNASKVKNILAANGIEIEGFDENGLLGEYARYAVTKTEKDKEFVALAAEAELHRADASELTGNRIRLGAAKVKSVYD